jgi:sporulation protein YlmC with PRC-barrel domain
VKGEMSRLVRASKLLGAKVVDKDNKKIGLLVNVIFNINPDFLYANLLVFPDTTKSLLKRLSDAIKDNALDYIEENFPADYPKVKSLVEKSSEQALKMLEKYLQEKEKELMKTYYVVPVTETENPEQESIEEIRIKHGHIDCDQFRCEPDINEEFPFFRNRSFAGLETLLTTTLNLEPVEGLSINLPDDRKGRTVDLELDYDGGVVENLVVQTYGKGAGKHLVNAKEFDFSELKAKNVSPMPNASD